MSVAVDFKQARAAVREGRWDRLNAVVVAPDKSGLEWTILTVDVVEPLGRRLAEACAKAIREEMAK